ncbi:MAG: NADH-quinone oxidoreductase subunit J [Caldilinea sp.]|uniref:NADH-quinone oxidoreductase subunit J family protein n=1 Tax=Caldilinea sp. TaxID=2293560 RepID=UPI002B55A1EC|nr:NADH-quinone oxidoreductase subunit J [Anaerolineales bacterium]HQY92098.1 NADH-quinone oxidoreductase subunit J [Caldilinea sp.]HRA65340.1 NADH-quinone oxidoreductase subunit J [Caldilinea sp.]
MPELPFPLPPLPTVSQVVFLMIAVLAVFGSLAVVLARNLFHSALGLVAAFFGAAGVYIVAEAEFIGVSQVLVYVGAISTLIAFAIMLTRGMMFGATSPRNRQSGTAAIITALTFVVLMALMRGIPWPQAGEPIVDGQLIIAGLGHAFVNEYVVPFVLLAMLLLVALAGAIVVARDRK